MATNLELKELKEEIFKLRNELRNFIENSNQKHVDLIFSELKEKYSEIFYNKELDNAKSSLKNNMVENCPMKDQCYSVFLDFLKNTAKYIKEGEISESIVNSYRNKLKELHKNSPKIECDTCFLEAGRLFEKQIELMKALGIYKKEENLEYSLSEISEEDLIKNLLEPIANKHRFMILKALSSQTRTFSDLSKITNLRGGNLLFHIKKLQESNLIIQRSERGDYMITKKGYDIVNTISKLYMSLDK